MSTRRKGRGARPEAASLIAIRHAPCNGEIASSGVFVTQRFFSCAISAALRARSSRRPCTSSARRRSSSSCCTRSRSRQFALRVRMRLTAVPPALFFPTAHRVAARTATRFLIPVAWQSFRARGVRSCEICDRSHVRLGHQVIGETVHGPPAALDASLRAGSAPDRGPPAGGSDIRDRAFQP